MIDHIGIRVRNIEASIAFYTTLLDAQAIALAKNWHGVQLKDHATAQLFLQQNPDHLTQNGYFSLALENNHTVDKTYQQALALGATVISTPKMRQEYGIEYYGFILKDIDDNVFGIISKNQKT